ncbi:MAG: IS1595 family transposase [Sedimentisphaerales bacterium]|jgi:transposase-like protein
MKNENRKPETLIEAIQFFSDEDMAIQFLASVRWPEGAKCPVCGRTDVVYLARQRRWQCKSVHEHRQFSVKVGTIFEDSAVPLGKWLIALWMEANAKNSISSYEVSRAIKVTQKTAWFMQQRIRLALQQGTFTKMTGEVEIDETFIGGKFRNMHAGVQRAKGRGSVGKAVVMGLLQRHGEVRTLVVNNTRRKTLQPYVLAHVEKGSRVYTDALRSYAGLNAEYLHEFIDHAECYVRGNVHTNGLENFWSLFKRCIKGTHVSIEPFHLFRYLDAETFRFNNRKIRDGERFQIGLSGVNGKRLTYKALIGETEGLLPNGNAVGNA